DSKAGIDPSRNNHYFLIPNWGLYKVVDLLCRRQSIRGRVTHVYHLRKVDDAKKILDDPLSNVIDLTIDTSTARYPTSTSRPRTEGIAPSSNRTSTASSIGKRSRKHVVETGSSKRHKSGSDHPANKQYQGSEKLEWQGIDRNDESPLFQLTSLRPSPNSTSVLRHLP
ncbi:hypothetical protein SERLA73DRAFT_182781, partial [Serpula lacrymans var. lacrymans S7.3]